MWVQQPQSTFPWTPERLQCKGSNWFLVVSGKLTEYSCLSEWYEDWVPCGVRVLGESGQASKSTHFNHSVTSYCTLQ